MQSRGQKAGCSVKPEWADLGKGSAWNLGNSPLPGHTGALAHSLDSPAPLGSEAFACVIQVMSDLLPSFFITIPCIHSPLCFNQPEHRKCDTLQSNHLVKNQGARTPGLSPISVFTYLLPMWNWILLLLISHSKSVSVSRFRDTLQTMSSYLHL